TAPLFKNSAPVEGTRKRSNVSAAEVAAVSKILDLIADPTRSHFFNTDCASCHTDTRRGMVKIGSPFKGIDVVALPQSNYNVRNLGWFSSTAVRGPAVPTATRRVRTETEEGLRCINATLASNGVTAVAECPTPVP